MKIAIVGAGIGGCSTARFCREEFPEADIHVFERSDQLGGRARLFNDAGESYEAGASIIHDKNQYMSDFATEFQLDKLKPALTRLTLHDGKKAVFEGSSHKPLALAQLLWRYGLGPLRLNHWVEGFLRSFQEIYQLQKASESFTLPSRLLAALDPAFASMLSTRLRDAMLEKGFSGKMLEELVQGMVRINYGQGLDVGAFVGAVALCGFVGPLWAVKGGNHLIAEKLLDSSSARWIRGKVLRIARSSDASRYRVEAKLSGAEHWEEDYDLVFLAAPQYDSELEIIVASKEKLTIARKYQQIFATFFRVPPTSSSLACTDPPGGTILSTAGGNFNSLGQYDTTSGSGPQIWKSFSNSPLDVDSEKALFPEKPQETYAWWAYPVYDTEDERGREIPFCLDDHGLFYCNAIEAAASAMEMAVIGAKNCVLLAKNRLKGLTEKIDKTRSKL